MPALTIDHPATELYLDADKPDERWTVEIGSATEVCYGCGTVQGLNDGASYARHGDARFCLACLHRLTGDEIERIVRAVALQGVPFS